MSAFISFDFESRLFERGDALARANGGKSSQTFTTSASAVSIGTSRFLATSDSI